MYFNKPGVENTEQVAECVARYLKEQSGESIEQVVLATVSGHTARVMRKALPSVELIAVTHVIGMKENGEDEMPATEREALVAMGVRLVTATHVLSGAERGISTVWGGAGPIEVMAQTLRMLGAGVKVAVECAVMALDAGAIPYGKKVISIGGTYRGADAAVVMRPAHASRILETQIGEILCKPKDFAPQITVRRA